MIGNYSWENFSITRLNVKTINNCFSCFFTADYEMAFVTIKSHKVVIEQYKTQ